jgi:hypothetical protein
MPSMRRGSRHTPESIAKMQATRARMLENPEYAARMAAHAKRYLGAHTRQRTHGWTRASRSGADAPNAKLSAAQVAEMRQRYAAGDGTLKGLAQDYGVVWQTILRHVRDVTPPPHRPRPSIQGEKHPKAKLTDAQVAEIRRRYAAGGVTQQALAQAYGVGWQTIHGHIRGQHRPER